MPRGGPIILLVVGLLIALLLGEGLVRVSGHKPWQAIQRFDGIPTMTQPDSQLGWTNRPGQYKMSAVPGMPAVDVTLGPDGSRQSGTRSDAGHHGNFPIWFAGCSLTYGWGVGDDKTFAAVTGRSLAEKGLRGMQTKNLGVAGYGTLQTWMLVERQLMTAPPPKVVVYGYFSGHAERNLALPSFTRVLDQAASQQAWVKMPYARQSTDETIQLFPPQRYRRWLGAEYSALINLAQETFDRVTQRSLEPTKSMVTMSLLKNLSRDVKARGSEFVVAILHLSDDDSAFRDSLQTHGIRYIDLTDMGFPGPETIIVGDGHPNEMMHARWGERLGMFLEPILQHQSSSTSSR